MEGEHRVAENEKEKENEEEEYLLLNLDEVIEKVNIPPNAPYVLSGLDTLNPILIIDNKLKLVGEYDETIGTCYIFTEQDAARVVHEETGPSETNLFSGACIIDSNQPTTKQVRPVSSLHKIIRFRLIEDTDVIPVLKDSKYADSHEWAKIDGNVAILGITDHAQDHLGDVVYVELPEAGVQVKQGKSFGAVESVKATSEINSPVSGKVTAVNDELSSSPGLLAMTTPIYIGIAGVPFPGPSKWQSV